MDSIFSNYDQPEVLPPDFLQKEGVCFCLPPGHPLHRARCGEIYWLRVRREKEKACLEISSQSGEIIAQIRHDFSIFEWAEPSQVLSPWKGEEYALLLYYFGERVVLRVKEQEISRYTGVSDLSLNLSPHGCFAITQEGKLSLVEAGGKVILTSAEICPQTNYTLFLPDGRLFANWQETVTIFRPDLRLDTMVAGHDPMLDNIPFLVNDGVYFFHCQIEEKGLAQYFIRFIFDVKKTPGL